MTDWPAVPVFGDPVPQFPAVVRPGAYGIITNDDGQLALVRTPVGVYLPGGGQADEEAPELALEREVREECGVAVRVGRWRRAAVEHVSSRVERTHFEKRSTFCDAALVALTGEATEEDHVLMWVSPDESIAVLGPESHRWAVTEWLRDGAPTDQGPAVANRVRSGEPPIPNTIGAVSD
jgi:8-oxo-dGTP diphosphatase